MFNTKYIIDEVGATMIAESILFHLKVESSRLSMPSKPSKYINSHVAWVICLGNQSQRRSCTCSLEEIKSVNSDYPQIS